MWTERVVRVRDLLRKAGQLARRGRATQRGLAQGSADTTASPGCWSDTRRRSEWTGTDGEVRHGWRPRFKGRRRRPLEHGVGRRVTLAPGGPRGCRRQPGGRPHPNVAPRRRPPSCAQGRRGGSGRFSASVRPGSRAGAVAGAVRALRITEAHRRGPTPHRSGVTTQVVGAKLFACRGSSSGASVDGPAWSFPASVGTTLSVAA